MKDYKILIPSFQRSKRQPTLYMLFGDVFTREDIVIATQTESDYSEYSSLYGSRATVIYSAGNSVGDNRNTLLDWAQRNGVSRAVMLDDDITAFKFHNFYRTKEPAEINSLFRQCFAIADRCGAVVWGTYPMDNPQSMYAKVTTNLLTGT